jgi:hypothetical protein
MKERVESKLQDDDFQKSESEGEEHE